MLNTETILAEIQAEFTSTEEIFGQLSVELDWEAQPVAISSIIREHADRGALFACVSPITFKKAA